MLYYPSDKETLFIHKIKAITMLMALVGVLQRKLFVFF